MTDFLNDFKNKLADEKLKKGEGTGPTSKLFSLLSSHVLILLIVFLLRDNQYIPLIIFLVFGFTRLALFLGLLGIAYFIFTQYWTGVTLISIYTGFAALSGIVGHRYIKQNLFNGKTNISPFEGMNDLAVLYFIQLGLFGFAIYTHGILSVILWVLYSLVTLFIFSRVWMRLKSKWCSIYYPLSIRYAHFIGHEVGSSQRAGKTPNIENAVMELLKNVYPNYSETETETFIQTVRKKLSEFSDRNDLISYCKQLYQNPDEEVYTKIFDKIQKGLINDGDRQLPFYFYAEVIERDFGKSERLKFMMEVFNGKVV